MARPDEFDERSSGLIRCLSPQGEWLCGLVNTGCWGRTAGADPRQRLTIFWVAEGRLLDIGRVDGAELAEGAAASYYAALHRAVRRGLSAPRRISVNLHEIRSALAAVTGAELPVVYNAHLDLGLWEEEAARACVESRGRIFELEPSEEALPLEASSEELWRSQLWQLDSNALFTISAPSFGIPWGGAVLRSCGAAGSAERCLLLFPEWAQAERFAADDRPAGDHLLLLRGPRCKGVVPLVRTRVGAVYDVTHTERRALAAVTHALARFVHDTENLTVGDTLLANRFCLQAGGRTGAVDIALQGTPAIRSLPELLKPQARPARAV